MPEEQGQNPQPVQYVYPSAPANSGILKWILGGLAVLFMAGTSYYMSDARTRLANAEKAQQTAVAETAVLKERISKADAATQSVAAQLGITKQQLSARAEHIQGEQVASTRRLEEENKAADARIGAVSGEVSSVKTEVASTKTDVAATRTDLDATKKKLESTIGDLGMQTGLIAHTRDELDILKHKGDRNYYEFSLNKGSAPQTVATVALQLRKTDQKRGRFTMNVTSDDKVIEKKDRTVAEPIQFYSGRDHLLYELVVWTVDKNKVTGYVSTPKGAPTPVTP